MANVLNMDFSKCERELPHPVTWKMTPVSLLTPEQIEKAEEQLSFDEAIHEMIQRNQKNIHILIA